MSAKYPACMPYHSRSADLLPKHTQITERSQHQHSKEPASKLDTAREQRSQHKCVGAAHTSRTWKRYAHHACTVYTMHSMVTNTCIQYPRVWLHAMAGMVAMGEPRGTHTRQVPRQIRTCGLSWLTTLKFSDSRRAGGIPWRARSYTLRQVEEKDTIVRLRWYDAAIELVWNNWYNEDDGPLPDEPPEGGMAWLFGMPGVGKTEWRHCMAIHILKQLEDDGAGVLVFDHATGYQRRVALVRQNLRGRYKGAMDRCTSKVATTVGQQSVESAAAAAKRVFHLSDGSSGCFFGARSWARTSTNRTNTFTVVSSCHHTALEKRATEYQKEPPGRGGPGLRTVASPSVLDELLHLKCSRGEGGLSDDAVVATFEK